MVEVGKSFWSSSCPILPFKQNHLKLVVQDHVQTAFESLQVWRLHKLSGQTVPVLTYCASHSFLMTPTAYQFVPITSFPVTRHYWKEPSSILFAPFLQIFTQIDKLHPESSLCKAQLSQSSQPLLTGEMLQTPTVFVPLLKDSFQYVNVSGAPKSSDCPTQMMSHPEQRARISSLDALAMLCLMHPRIPSSAFTGRVHCWLVFSLASIRSLFWEVLCW